MKQIESVVRQAELSDLPQVVDLINRAFAIERFFKSGDRTNPGQVRDMMAAGKFLLLEESDDLAACVWVKITGERGYIGTLSVDPARQRSGIGRRMMQEAEDYCRAAGCNVLDIRIVNVRTELPAIYHKFGFVETGTDSAQAIKNATRPIHFINMSKPLQ